MLLLTVVFSTYAIYRSVNTGGGEVNTAAWSVKIGEADFETVTKVFTANDLVCTGGTSYTASKVEGKIAPDSLCTITVPVDATGSEEDVIVEAELGTVTLPTGMSVSLASGANSQRIAYNASSMTADVVLNVEWAGAIADETSKDTTDKAKAGSTISIPVTLTARQALHNEQ